MNMVWIVSLWYDGQFETVAAAFNCRKDAYDYVEKQTNDDIEKGFKDFTYKVYERSVR